MSSSIHQTILIIDVCICRLAVEYIWIENEFWVFVISLYSSFLYTSCLLYTLIDKKNPGKYIQSSSIHTDTYRYKEHFSTQEPCQILKWSFLFDFRRNLIKAIEWIFRRSNCLKSHEKIDKKQYKKQIITNFIIHFEVEG